MHPPSPKVLVWQWGRFGAGPRFAYELAQALSKICGYRTILSLAQNAELMQSSACRDAVDFPLRTYAGPSEFALRTLALHELLRPIAQRLTDDPPAAAIVPMMGYWDIAFMRILRRLGIPVISVAHDIEVHPGDRFHLIGWLQRRMFRMSQGVVTLTDFVARQLRSRVQLGGQVHATIPLPAFGFPDLKPPAPRLPQANAATPLRLLIAGRLKRYKGLELLAEAAKRVGNGHALVLRVVGAPQAERDIEALRAVPGVEFDLGWKSDREIIAHLDWADATVLPYIEASQSGLAPMSLARGRPVIATPVGGLPEQIRNDTTGLVTESVSVEALAAAIKRFAGDRALLRHCGENALRFAQTEIAWERIAPRYAEVLEAVIAGRKRESASRALSKK